MAPAVDKDKANGEPKQRRRPGRVPVSCAECRRLKLRCDRKVPCETCVKRGCSAICPEGALTTGKGNRLAFADADELNKKIERLRNRSTQLEDALRKLQAAVSDDPHPLLQDDSSSPSGSSPEISANGASPDGPGLTQDDEQFLDAFGTLTLGLRGEARFFGQTSRSEYLIHAPERPTRSIIVFPHLSDDIVREANMELDAVCTNQQMGLQLTQKLLPPLSQACHLCEIFLEFGQFVWFPLPRAFLFDDILGAVYRTAQHNECNAATVHATALMFMIFALGTLFDLNLPPYAVEAHEYYLLSRLCLRYAPPAHDTTLLAIQTMIYMSQYLDLSDCEPAHTGSQKAWTQIGTAVKMGHSIGLHVNSARWRLDDEACQKRAFVFWQLFKEDAWLSFGFGRPPCMSLSFIDCDFPKDPEERFTEDGHKEWSFHHWTWQYSKLLHAVMTTAFGAKTPRYHTIMDLDRKIRDFPVPYSLRIRCGQVEDPPPSTARIFQRVMAVAAKEATLLSLHRPYFAHALNEQPGDILRHRFGPSVVATYRSAWRIIEGARDTYRRCPAIAGRIGLVWSQCLAGGIVMCLLVTRAPTSNLAASSLQELDKLCELFEQAAEHCQIASNNLEVVRKLRRQGHEATNKTHAENGSSAITLSELDRLSGKTHLISREQSVLPTCTLTSGTFNPQMVSAPRVDYSSFAPPVPTEYIHPTIMLDMRSFENENTVEELEKEQFNLDFPSNSFPNSQPVPSTLPDLGFDSDFYMAQMGFTGSDTELPHGPPVLDPTWQTFVEQLGF
ncbi:hypothetical protein OBBRIDRAFT_830653 [Obba rivulosa]|uniref:Zn(2)-C6 fungal-type domain-containing protein n=1 Tax=Obba rivulosa TaxID=1052685 RepID=A0A8E2DTK5_9APHY|nr:hypothetical protein OBBRIDRAFT_830653 [Obba rivulosa]